MNAATDAAFVAPAWPAPASVRALLTTRVGGTSAGAFDSFNLALHVGDDPSAVARNRALLREQLPAEPVWMNQVHGTVVIDAGGVRADATAAISADAAVATVPGAVCVVMSADCLPVLFAADDGTAVGIAHAGWRGMANGVLEATVARMRVAPARLLAYLGAAIGPAAYEVGADVVEAFRAHDAAAQRAFVTKAGGKFWCDLYALARQRLAGAGVEQVFGGGACTFTERDRYFSFRRDGRTGRMASLIWIAA